MTRDTVALIPAGGTIRLIPNENPTPKALMQVYGRPLLDYIVQALEQSSVEKTFIIQDHGVDLQASLSPAAKVVILEKDRDITSTGLGFIDALRRIARTYGPEEIKQKNILILPCDLPAVTASMIDQLVPQAVISHADLYITYLASELVKRRYPQKRFYKFYLADKKGWFTVPFVYFINGEFFEFHPGPSPESEIIGIRGWDQERLESFENLLNSIVKMRKEFAFTAKFFLHWMLKDKNLLTILNLIFTVLSRQMTEEKFIRYEYALFRDHVEAIYNPEPCFCGDVDSLQDADIVLGSLQESLEPLQNAPNSK